MREGKKNQSPKREFILRNPARFSGSFCCRLLNFLQNSSLVGKKY